MSPLSATHTLTQGTSPLLVSMPHIASAIPSEYAASFVTEALAAQDTDWHLDALYNFLPTLGASVLTPSVSRYVIDLNRPPSTDAQPMYAGSNNTELCPTRFFTGQPLYRPGCEPTATDIEQRREKFWQPYHAALTQELARIKAIHGYALLWDVHSIRSQLPWLFEGKLPDFNIGTANGDAAHASITAAVAHVCADQGEYTHVVNGRFKGGYITRNYGNPEQHVHAIQLEKCWSTYMQEQAPYTFDVTIASGVQPLLKRMVEAAMHSAKALYA